MIFWEKRDVYTGQLASNTEYHRREPVHRLIISASACNSPCHCQGYEICAHLLYRGSRSPIHPVFSALSEEEARLTSTRLRKYLRLKLAPLPDEWTAKAEDDLSDVVRAFGVSTGFGQTEHVVWRKLEGFSGFLHGIQEKR